MASTTLSANPMLQQFIRFALVGLGGTAVHYGLLLLLVELASLTALYASMLGALAGAVVNYFLNYRFTFASTAKHRKTMPKFFFLAGLGLSLNALLMWWLLTWPLFSWQWYYLAAQIMVTALILLFNFFANRFWTFRSDL